MRVPSACKRSRSACDDGLVRALFEDGTSAEGDVLVVADGANSRVRDVRLPGLKRQDLGVLTIAGRFPLTAEHSLPAAFIDGSVNNVVPGSPGWMFAAAWRMPDAGYVTWAYADARSNFPASAPTPPCATRTA